MQPVPENIASGLICKRGGKRRQKIALLNMICDAKIKTHKTKEDVVNIKEDRKGVGSFVSGNTDKETQSHPLGIQMW